MEYRFEYLTILFIFLALIVPAFGYEAMVHLSIFPVRLFFYQVCCSVYFKVSNCYVCKEIFDIKEGIEQSVDI